MRPTRPTSSPPNRQVTPHPFLCTMSRQVCCTRHHALARTNARTVRNVQGTFCLSTLNMDYTNLDIDTADMLAPYAIAGALQLNAQRAVAEGVFLHAGGHFMSIGLDNLSYDDVITPQACAASSLANWSSESKTAARTCRSTPQATPATKRPPLAGQKIFTHGWASATSLPSCTSTASWRQNLSAAWRACGLTAKKTRHGRRCPSPGATAPRPLARQARQRHSTSYAPSW